MPPKEPPALDSVKYAAKPGMSKEETWHEYAKTAMYALLAPYCDHEQGLVARAHITGAAAQLADLMLQEQRARFGDGELIADEPR